jgi:hypothetical protein
MNMKTSCWREAYLAAAAVGLLFLSTGLRSAEPDPEKQKALSNPYANDLGPDSLEGFPWVSTKDYPADVMAGYALLRSKCAQCHSAARPLNSQFVEPDGPKEEKAARAQKMLAEPGVAGRPHVWQVEPDIWQRYVKRMMSKPGCGIQPDEGKKIWAFLCADSARRKTGKSAGAWKAHREKLLSDFKVQQPERHKELYGDK